jgi:hypothetical protein
MMVLFSTEAECQNTAITTRPKVDRIVTKLRKEKLLHIGAPVGFSGAPETKNKYYRLYNKLSLISTNEELERLTNDSTNTIVAYSFLILASRHYEGLKQVFLHHLADTTEFWIAAGCTGALARVNRFMLSNLYFPSDSVKSYLTKNEYEEYLKLIAGDSNR